MDMVQRIGELRVGITVVAAKIIHGAEDEKSRRVRRWYDKTGPTVPGRLAVQELEQVPEARARAGSHHAVSSAIAPSCAGDRAVAVMPVGCIESPPFRPHQAVHPGAVLGSPLLDPRNRTAPAIRMAMFASLVLVGLVAGIFLATQLGQVRVQNTLDARDFTLVKHRFEVALGKVMPVLVVIAGLSIAPLVFLLYSDGLVRFIAVMLALLLWAGVIIATLVYNAPVNALAVEWDPSAPPADWQQLRDQWHRGQAIRTPLALAAFVAIAFAAVFPSTGR
jgi:Anthrone oxygenase